MGEIDHFIIGKTFGLTNNKTASTEHIKKIKEEKERAIYEAEQAIKNMETGAQRVIDIHNVCCQQVANTLTTIMEKTEAMMGQLQKYHDKLLAEDPKIRKLAETILNMAEKNFNHTLELLQTANSPILEKTKTALQSVETMTVHFQKTLTLYSEALKKAHMDTEQLYIGEFVGNGLRSSVKEEI